MREYSRIVFRGLCFDMRIAIDAMSGDRAPEEIVSGACDAARDFGVEIVLVGDDTAMRAVIAKRRRKIEAKVAKGKSEYSHAHNADGLPRGVSLHHTTELVAMDESPMKARRKRDSSMAVATRLHAEGKADAVLSAGNTGAAATLALFTLKRIEGIDRPGIATVFPTMKNPMVLIDAGANVDSRPRNLAEFAIMGAAYAGRVHGIIPGTDRCIVEGTLPRVGLLSIGEESSKGNDLTKNAFPLLAGNAADGGYVFHGNVEGRDLGYGTVDVMVCDGFVGNVVLKVGEGLAKLVGSELRKALTATPRAKIGAALLKPSLLSFKNRIDYTQYGGAVLLGVNGVCIICHGSADAASIYSAIRIARQTVAADVVGSIRATMEKNARVSQSAPETSRNGVAPLKETAAATL